MKPPERKEAPMSINKNNGLKLVNSKLTVPPKDQASWLNPDGTPLALGRLKQRARKWSLETWNRYLALLDCEQGFKRESRLCLRTLEEELAGETYELDECTEGPKDYSILHAAIQALTPLQRRVIESIYFAGQTVRETAEKMGIPRSTVQDLKSQALSALYAKIPDTSPLVRGEVEFSIPNEGRKSAA
jgi:RNA polymerase sigma factor (sigma-70 family)